MPLYEYQCQDCDTHFERIEKVSSPTDGVCPSCGGAARRLLGAPALQFKGSGWYVNDYGKGNGTPASQTEPKHETTSESNHEAASESKSEASTKTESSTKSESSPKSGSTTKTDSKVA